MYAMIAFYLYFGGLTAAHVELFDSMEACQRRAKQVYATAVANDQSEWLNVKCFETD